MKKPSDLTIEQMKKLPPKRLKAYKNKLLDYRRAADVEDVEDVEWVKKKIIDAQDVIKGEL